MNKIGRNLLKILGITLLGLSLNAAASSWQRVEQPADAHLGIKSVRHGYVSTLHRLGAKVFKLGQTVRIIIPSDQLFNHNSANFIETYPVTLDAVTDLMRTYSTVSIKVASYSDNMGWNKRKQALTTRQAQVIAGYLWSQNLNTRFIYAIGYGRAHAVAKNHSAFGRRDNRRIEISFRFYPKTQVFF